MTAGLRPNIISNVSEQAFQVMVEDAPDSIFLCDSKGIIQYANTQALPLLGYTKEELLGHSIDMLVPDSARSDHEERRIGYAKSPHKRPMGAGLNLAARRKDGSLVPVEISLSPVTVNSEPCVLAIVRDVSLVRQLTRDLQDSIADLRRSNAELEQFAYVASHDLQEPLRMISGYAQLLLKRYGDKLDANGREYIDYTVDGVKRMQTLINDLLSYSRLHARNQPAIPVDLHTTMQHVQKNLALTIEESNAKIHITKLPVIQGDPALMLQLFQNLVGNAIKFRQQNTPPDIHIHYDESTETFSVKDNGIGIDPNDAQKIFAIFQRLHNRDDIPGSGIGLAVCKKIVEYYDGMISVVPAADGKGSIFQLTLPRATNGAS